LTACQNKIECSPAPMIARTIKCLLSCILYVCFQLLQNQCKQ
jgi:hypothetical protein